jgi:YebC/PmpR family DNA-binding regulatory protein
MGKSWKNAAMTANAQKKGALFTKLAREITVAARLGGPDPDANSRLRLAVNAARAESCPKDTIERAIKKGAGLLEGSEIEECLYEGFGPHNVGIMVECQTDNRHRTAPDIRNLFKKHGGQMGEPGSVAWMFDRLSLVEGKPGQEIRDAEEEAIEAGANEVSRLENGHYRFWGAIEDLDSIRGALTDRGWDITTAEISYKPQNFTDLNEEQLQETLKLLEALDDNEDSHRIHVSIDV